MHRLLGTRPVRFLPGLVLALVLPAGGSALPAESAPDSAVATVWPLDLPERYLTSNFMEFRPGRFHAGLDLKTRSQMGYAARAVEDGWILRVRATPGAYGRAVYLRGLSGRTYVYAHLSRFNDPIRARVRAGQERTGTYRTRLSFRENELPVKAGEVIGLTGQSGTMGPHLHFEVRDRENRPINPLENGFTVDDRIPPVIHAVRAVPVTPSARLEGRPGARALEGPVEGEQPPLHLYGPVAFAAKIVDASDEAGHRLEPWLIEVRLDGEVVYTCRNDRFDFAESSLQRLEWLEVPGIRDHWLHRRPADTLPGREGGLWYLGPAGKGLADGDHRLEITASDFAGNTVTAVLPLKVGLPPRGASAWREEPVWVAADSLSNGFGVSRLTPFFNVMVEDENGWKILHLDPAAGDPVHAPVRLGVRRVPLGSEHLEMARSQGLTLQGRAVEFAAADWPVSAAVPVDMPGAVRTGDGDPEGDPPGSAPTVGDPPTGPASLMYRWTRKGWRPAGPLLTPEVPGGIPRFLLSDPGVYAVFADGAAPVVTVAADPLVVTPSDSSSAHGVSLPRWSVIPVGVDDKGSGVAAETISVLLDGAPLVSEPDLIRDRILVELPDATTPGRHELVVTCLDEAGHETTKTISLECRTALR